MTDEFDTMVRRYLDGELSTEREPEALRRMADDAEARALLRLELQARAQGSTPVHVPTGFADRTMAAIEAAEAAEAEAVSSVIRHVAEQMWRWLVTPRPLRIRPGLAAVAAVLIVGVVLHLEAPSGDMEPSAPPLTAASATASAQQEVVWSRFMYTDNEASSVAVAGDFSGWEPISLSAQRVDGQTVWTGIVPVSKGEHQYMFVIDDAEWVTDPLAPVQRSDGFGNKNAVLQL